MNPTALYHHNAKLVLILSLQIPKKAKKKNKTSTFPNTALVYSTRVFFFSEARKFGDPKKNLLICRVEICGLAKMMKVVRLDFGGQKTPSKDTEKWRPGSCDQLICTSSY